MASARQTAPMTQRVLLKRVASCRTRMPTVRLARGVTALMIGRVISGALVW